MHGSKNNRANRIGWGRIGSTPSAKNSQHLWMPPSQQVARLFEGLESSRIGSGRFQLIKQHHPLIDFLCRQDLRRRRGVEMLVAEDNMRRVRSLVSRSR